MKTKLSIIAILAISALTIPAPSPNTVTATLSWQYTWPSDPNVVDFRVVSGSVSGQYTWTNSVGGTNLSMTISGLARGATYYFAVSAIGDNGLESDYSNEAVLVTAKKPRAPTNTTVSTSP